MAIEYKLSGKRVAILATDGFDQSQLIEPKEALERAGAQVEVVSQKPGCIRGWMEKDWGDPVRVDRTLDSAYADDYDALVLPGGVMNSDKLRRDPAVRRFVAEMFGSGKPLGAICRGPWMLIDAGCVAGRRMTSYESIQMDLKNAGALWVNQEVVVDNGLVTSRKPADIPAFNAKLIEEIAECVYAVW